VRLLLAIALLPASLSAAPEFGPDARPILAKYCFSCHGEEKQEGGIALHELQNTEDAYRSQLLLQQIADQVEGDDMPPFEAKEQPTDPERTTLLHTVKHLIGRIERGDVPKNPGRVTIRRLNRNEYNYTVRDLFGVKFQPGRNFPADGDSPPASPTFSGPPCRTASSSSSPTRARSMIPRSCASRSPA
jgi:hypothetical protein